MKLKDLLNEMPQHYPGGITYQKDSKFPLISVRNTEDYTVMGETSDFVYMVDPGQTTGYVFDVHELKKKQQHVRPVMRVSLRDTNIKGYKQACYLRIREAYSKNNIASQWYHYYVKQFGGVVSDFEHLEGGKSLWKSFIKRSPNSVYLIDSRTNQQFPITSDTKDDDIWSQDQTKKHLLIVYEAS